jgi:hypothetical protein
MATRDSAVSQVNVRDIYAKATRPTRPATKAMAGLALLLAAPVKVATGAAEVAAGV